jgi:hypothetical protein
MKRLITCVAAVIIGAGAITAQAQSKVNFNNSVLPSKPLVFDVDGTTALVGTNYVAQLYYSIGGGAWTAVSAAPAKFRISTTSQPGTWSGGTRDIPVPLQTTVRLQVCVWDSVLATSYDDALARGAGNYGQSTVFNYMNKVSEPPATSDTYMDNFTSFKLVPEPSTIGLALLGGLAFLIRRRK